MNETKALRQWRAERYLSVEALAARAGVSGKTIWNLEHGKPAHGSTLLKIAAALGIEPGQIEEAKR
jgi:transcriptional regulator with XRE-family HTH domain